MKKKLTGWQLALVAEYDPIDQCWVAVLKCSKCGEDFKELFKVARVSYPGGYDIFCIGCDDKSEIRDIRLLKTEDKKWLK